MKKQNRENSRRRLQKEANKAYKRLTKELDKQYIRKKQSNKMSKKGKSSLQTSKKMENLINILLKKQRNKTALEASIVTTLQESQRTALSGK